MYRSCITTSSGPVSRASSRSGSEITKRSSPIGVCPKVRLSSLTQNTANREKNPKSRNEQDGNALYLGTRSRTGTLKPKLNDEHEAKVIRGRKRSAKRS